MPESNVNLYGEFSQQFEWEELRPIIMPKRISFTKIIINFKRNFDELYRRNICLKIQIRYLLTKNCTN